jgi:hypothetical protein
MILETKKGPGRKVYVRFLEKNKVPLVLSVIGWAVSCKPIQM